MRKRTTKKVLWRDIRLTFKKSTGRFISILLLIALGSFSLSGFKLAGPDMRATSSQYFQRHAAADLTVIGSMGIDQDDVEQISEASGVKNLEFGYLRDVTVDRTDDALRVFSAPQSVSTYELAEGRMPESAQEIAVDRETARQHPVGSNLSVVEKAAADGSYALKEHTFAVVGVVNSTEILSTINRGMTQAGSGDLKGYAVVVPEAFDTDYYMIARLTFEDVAGLDPYSQEYTDKVATHKDELNGLLANQPVHRLATVSAQRQDAIDEGQLRLDDAQSQLDGTRSQLADAATQIADSKRQIATSQGRLDDASQQLQEGQEKLDASWERLAQAQQQLSGSAQELDATRTQLASAKEQLEAGWSRHAQQERLYQQKQAEYQQALSDAPAQKQQIQSGIAQCDAALATAQTALASVNADLQQVDAALAQPKITEAEQSRLETQRMQLSSQRSQLESTLQQTRARREELAQTSADIDARLSDAQDQLSAAEAQLTAALQTLEARQERYDIGYAQYQAGVQAYQVGLGQYHAGFETWKSGTEELQNRTDEYRGASQRIVDAKEQLSQREQEYQNAQTAFDQKEPEVQREIADGQQSLADAKEALSNLEEPSYNVYNRREIPGGEGYRIYESVSEIVDSLSNIFPYFLFLVAALVASTTMSRMVEEERINSGTLKALGYGNADVAKKFVVYGSAAAALGSLIGVAAGHTVLPLIVYNAYHGGFTVPAIELRFDPRVSLGCLAISFAVTVIPVLLAIRSEMREHPARLLLPKPPASGSKVLLEHVPLIWDKLSFSGKVTMRNLFRYKRRALMTIVGVAGAVSLLFMGLAVQNSVSGISSRQFGQIVTYNMVVAQDAYVSKGQRADIDGLLDSDTIGSHTGVTYQELSLQAGQKGDSQDIVLLVPNDIQAFAKYLHLQGRGDHQTLSLDADGAIISERLATLTGTKVGDTLTLKDGNGTSRSVRVAGICEMYMNHFMFMSAHSYQEVFGVSPQVNAHVVTLRDASLPSTQHVAAQFMTKDGVKGVVQSTALINQVSIIVSSLNKIMGMLVAIAMLLTVVILFNLVTINVAERVRELCTIKVLGFHSKEVALYIYRETIILSALAIPLGWAFGRFLQLYIITAVPPENVMFNPEPGIPCFVVSAALVAAVVAALYLVVKQSLKKVDMLEALKSVD